MRRILLAVLLGSLAAGCATTDVSAPPNVVLIISDDQMWTDFGFMGHPDIQTPHLDRLAARSAVFERGYVPSSLCRPSLASMITGLYPHQHKITGNDPPKGVQRDAMLAHIAAVPTLPRMLAPLGYQSLQTGKWWEGNCRCSGFTDGMTHGDVTRGGRHGDVGLEIGRKTMQPIYEFIDRSRQSATPFFVWYAPFLPHTPHNPPERLLARYRRPDRSIHVARYYAMCEWFDETCGQLLDHLEDRGLTEDTLVLFVTDNGWIQREDRRGYAPRSKRSPYDGGIRTPIMVSWPGRIRPGTRDALASSIDLAPTILRACGADIPAALPGQDLAAIAAGRAAPRTEALGAIFEHDVADVDRPDRSLLSRWIVADRWKLILPEGDRPAELFDVIADPHERVDLAATRPEDVRRLTAALGRWWSGRDAGAGGPEQRD